MSEVKRLPDAAGHWWIDGERDPVLFQDCLDLGLRRLNATGQWVRPRPGRYVACPCPDWRPEPPPRPPMVWASRQNEVPTWWVHYRTEKGVGWLNSMGYGAQTRWLTPHDHPEQSAEESRRILAEVIREN